MTDRVEENFGNEGKPFIPKFLFRKVIRRHYEDFLSINKHEMSCIFIVKKIFVNKFLVFNTKFWIFQSKHV